MNQTICGIDCSKCGMKDSCGGCIETEGHPFNSECVVAMCSQRKGYIRCSQCSDLPCKLKMQIIEEINGLGIEGMPEVKGLNEVKGAFINIEYTLPSGQNIKIWDDNKIYLANQISKKNSDGYYGVTADENHLCVCEYSGSGTNAEIIVYKKRGNGCYC